MNRSDFLAAVRAYVESDPEAAAHIADYVQAGLRDALSVANERAADMEVALSVACARRYKGADELIRQKLDKWDGRTALNWAWIKQKAGVA